MRAGNQNKLIFLSMFLILLFSFNNIRSESVEGNSVTLQLLDKVTAKISSVEIKIGEKYLYGSLEIEIFFCMKRPPEEIPEDFVLLKVIDKLEKDKIEIAFQGWMLSSSPTISPFEHPTYDVWVKDCKIDKESS